MALVNDVQPDEATILACARGLGSYKLLAPEHLSGPPVMHLRFDEAKAQSASRQAYFTCGEFPLHTDLSYVPKPPRYMLALCIEADQSGGGITTVASLEAAWSRISAREQKLLRQSVFSFKNAPNTGDDVCSKQPIYRPNRSRGIWRFRQDSLIVPDNAVAAIHSFSAALEQEKMHLLLRSGDLLIVDNHRIAHGRTSFEAPSARHFLRAYSNRVDA